MDASVLNTQNSPLSVVKQTSSAVITKGNIQSNSDIFLGMIKQISRENIGHQNGLETTLVQQTRNMASLTKSKTTQKPSFEKTEKAPVVKKDDTIETERKTVEKQDSSPSLKTSEKIEKPADKNTEVEKTESVTDNGQKIPGEEKDAVAQDETVLAPTEKAPLQIDGEEILASQDVLVDEFVVKHDENLQNDTVQDKIVQSAGVIGSIAVIAQQIITQTAPKEAVTEQIDVVETFQNTNNVAKAEGSDINSLQLTPEMIPDADKPVEETLSSLTGTETNIQNMNVDVSEKIDFNLENVTTTETETKTAIVENNDTISEDFIVKTDSLTQSAPVESIDITTKGNRNAVAQKQGKEIASKLPANTKIAVQVEQNVENAEIPVENVSNSSLTQENVSVKEQTSQNFTGVKEIRPASHYETAPIVNEQNNNNAGEGNARQNADTSTQTVNILQNAGSTAGKDASGFANALKSSTAIEGVSSVQNTAKADTALFGIQNPALKGKTDGTGQTAGTQTRPQIATNDLVDQIKVNITKAVQSGLEKVNITLKPKELGNIQVSLEIGEDGDLKATVIASRATTLDMLQKDASGLQKALSDAGFKLNENSLNFSYRGEQQQNAQAFANNSHSGHSQHSDTAENAVSNATGNASDIDDSLTEAVMASAWSSGRHTLNIRI